MADQRSRAATSPRPCRPSGDRREPVGDGFVMAPEAAAMLRAIRAEVDDQGAYRGSALRAARLAAVTADEASRLLTVLGARGFIRWRPSRG